MWKVFYFAQLLFVFGAIFYISFHLKKLWWSDVNLCTLGGHQVLEFIPVPVCNEPSKPGLITPSDQKLVPSTPCKLFREQPGTSSRTSLTVVCHVLDLETPWTYCSWYTEEYTDSFCCKSSVHMKSKLCSQNVPVQINVPFISISCIKQYLIRSLFWWNGHSPDGTGSYSRSSSHRRSKFPDKRYSSGMMKMDSVMQYPQKEQPADLQEIPLPALTDSLSLDSSSISLSGEIQQSKQEGKVNRTLLSIVNFRYLG